MKLISVVGARPNFMKIAPFIKAIKESNSNIENEGQVVDHILVHTGQHYDQKMNDTFFKSLGIPQADINLGVGSGSHAEQVGNTMIEFEKVLEKEKPDWVVVVGDVNATLACSVTAKKLGVKVCHIEAGLRSGDMSMPEEINRLVTDRLSDLLLIPDRLSGENLKNEGVADENIKFVGNIMIDTLEANKDKALSLDIKEILQDNLLAGQDHKLDAIKEISNNPYALLTMHRPSNVDEKDVLAPLFTFLSDEVTMDMPLIWPIHPRTVQMLKKYGLWDRAIDNPRLIVLEPLGYHEMLRLNIDARIMLTDSGGLQEECCVLGTPFLTLRWNTERPVTLVDHGGAGVLVGNNVKTIRKEYQELLKKDREPVRPELWDGKTAERCLNAIIEYEKPAYI